MKLNINGPNFLLWTEGKYLSVGVNKIIEDSNLGELEIFRSGGYNLGKAVEFCREGSNFASGQTQFICMMMILTNIAQNILHEEGGRLLELTSIGLVLGIKSDINWRTFASKDFELQTEERVIDFHFDPKAPENRPDSEQLLHATVVAGLALHDLDVKNPVELIGPLAYHFAKDSRDIHMWMKAIALSMFCLEHAGVLEVARERGSR